MPPVNDNRADAVALTLPADSHTQSTTDATLEVGEPTPSGNMDATVWFTVTSADARLVTVSLEGSDFDTMLAVWRPDDTLVAWNDDYHDLQSQVSWDAEPGQRYDLQVGGYDGDTGSLVLALSSVDPPPPPGNDDRADAVALALNSLHTQSTESATTEAGEPLPTGMTRTVWFTLEVAEATHVKLSTHGSDFDTVVAVYDAAMTQLAVGDDEMWTRSRVAWDAAPGTYHVQVGGKGGAYGTLELRTLGWPTTEPVPANDLQADAIPIALGQSLAGHNHQATVETGEPLPSSSRSGRSVWYALTGGEQGLRCTLSSDYFATLAVYSLVDGVLTRTHVDTADDYVSEIEFQPRAGRTYLVQVSGYYHDYGHFTLAVSPAFLGAWSPWRQGPAIEQRAEARYRAYHSSAAESLDDSGTPYTDYYDEATLIAMWDQARSGQGVKDGTIDPVVGRDNRSYWWWNEDPVGTSRSSWIASRLQAEVNHYAALNPASHSALAEQEIAMFDFYRERATTYDSDVVLADSGLVRNEDYLTIPAELRDQQTTADALVQFEPGLHEVTGAWFRFEDANDNGLFYGRVDDYATAAVPRAEQHLLTTPPVDLAGIGAAAPTWDDNYDTASPYFPPWLALGQADLVFAGTEPNAYAADGTTWPIDLDAQTDAAGRLWVLQVIDTIRKSFWDAWPGWPGSNGAGVARYRAEWVVVRVGLRLRRWRYWMPAPPEVPPLRRAGRDDSFRTPRRRGGNAPTSVFQASRRRGGGYLEAAHGCARRPEQGRSAGAGRGGGVGRAPR